MLADEASIGDDFIIVHQHRALLFWHFSGIALPGIVIEPGHLQKDHFLHAKRARNRLVEVGTKSIELTHDTPPGVQFQAALLVIGHGNELRIFLRRALKLKEIIVTATVLVWKIATHLGTCFVNRTASRFGIEKAADLAVMIVFLSPHHVLAAVCFFSKF